FPKNKSSCNWSEGRFLKLKDVLEAGLFKEIPQKSSANWKLLNKNNVIDRQSTEPLMNNFDFIMNDEKYNVKLCQKSTKGNTIVLGSILQRKSPNHSKICQTSEVNQFEVASFWICEVKEPIIHFISNVKVSFHSKIYQSKKREFK